MDIAVLVSGGVDSSVALRLLAERNPGCLRAFYLKIWLEDELSALGSCPWDDDIREVRKVCEPIGVPVEIVSLQREYHERVVTYAVDELRAGRTPSPDIFCNQRIKFGAFFEAIDGAADIIASGHYGIVREADGLWWLDRGVDRVKDQTYFLSHLRQDQLARCRFPLGALEKRRVRELALAYDLPNATRKDSQGICFLGKVRFEEFVRAYLGERAGRVVERESGRVLGEHRGYWFHTIGQRRGLGFGEGPWYVVGKDIEDNVVFVSHAEHRHSQSRRELETDPPHWITRPPNADADLSVKLRHAPSTVPCTWRSGADGSVTVELAESDPGVAPGQFCVFYEGETCLGAGRIRTGPARQEPFE